MEAGPQCGQRAVGLKSWYLVGRIENEIGFVLEDDELWKADVMCAPTSPLQVAQGPAEWPCLPPCSCTPALRRHASATLGHCSYHPLSSPSTCTRSSLPGLPSFQHSA